jgi:hypothetical protein
MTQPLQLAVHAVSKARNACIKVLSQSLRRAEQMRQATLPESWPVLIDQIPIAHQDAPPVGNELHKRGLEACWVHLEVCDLSIRHAP